MDTISLNSENSKISESHILILELADKLDLRKLKKILPYQVLVFTTNGKT